jgi:hypothetical protein
MANVRPTLVDATAARAISVSATRNRFRLKLPFLSVTGGLTDSSGGPSPPARPVRGFAVYAVAIDTTVSTAAAVISPLLRVLLM